MLPLFKFISALKHSDFVRSLLTLMTGTTIAAAIPVLCSPILTRIYTPEDIGIFAAIATVISILIPVITLRYDVALMLPKRHIDAGYIALLSLIIVILLTILSLVFIILKPAYLMNYLSVEDESGFIIIPFALGIAASANIYSALLNRQKKYRQLSQIKIYYAAFSTAIMILFGYFHANFIGLLYGFLLGWSIAGAYGLVKNLSLLRSSYRNFQFTHLRKLIKKYKKFPTFGTLGAFIGGVALNYHIILFAAFYTPEVVGLIFLVQRVLQNPLNIIRQAYSQVFFQKITTRKTMAHRRKLYFQSFGLLSIISILCIIAVQLLPTNSMAFIFGEEWGQILPWMKVLVFWICIQFVPSTLSVTLSALNKENYIMILQILNITLVFLTFELANMQAFSAYETIIALTIAKSGFYFIYLLLSIWVLYQKDPFTTSSNPRHRKSL